jgi:two-component system phosphate regulon sensor histidine kinase PhoR
MDDVFARILKENHLKHDLQYRLVIKTLSITFSGSNYIILFQNGHQLPLLDSSYILPEGASIDGRLQTLNMQNQVTSLTVSAPTAYSYQITFELYVDSPNRAWAILNLMKPTFALSFFSLLAVMIIYFFTFRNWLRQKKLAEMKSDFVNSITHEFHTPLATIMVANKSLQNEKIIEKKENIAPLTDIISRQTGRLKTIFSQVLDITVMNNATLKKESYYLGKLLEEILLDYRLTLGNKNVEIKLDKIPEDYLILLDKFWFTTTVLNLFENAIKYNSSPVKKIRIRAQQDKKMIQLSIADNGIGMSQKTIHHIFEKFYRSKNKSTEDVNGLGLGLFYVRQSVRAHGWTLDVESKEGEGTEFIIMMPKG